MGGKKRRHLPNSNNVIINIRTFASRFGIRGLIDVTSGRQWLVTNADLSVGFCLSRNGDQMELGRRPFLHLDHVQAGHFQGRVLLNNCRWKRNGNFEKRKRTPRHISRLAQGIQFRLLPLVSRDPPRPPRVKPEHVLNKSLSLWRRSGRVVRSSVLWGLAFHTRR